MNQTVTVNISGIVFHIEVDAYDNLKNYLNKIKGYFKNSEECDEIMIDIEARIAELFNSKLTSNNQVIRTKDVEEVITIMGKPEQYLDEEDVEEPQQYSSTPRYQTAKKLLRDPDDRLVGGVASGISAYFGIDAVWLRLFFVIALFMGFGFLLYIILWIVMPEAKTAADKLKMKGEPVNIDNIGRTVENEAKRVNEDLKNMNAGQYIKKAESGLGSIFNAIGIILMGFFKVLGKIIGVAFLIIGTFWLIGLIGLLVGSDAVLSITSEGIFSVDSSEFFDLIFVSQDQFHLALFGLILAMGIPIIALIYAGVNLLFKIKSHYGVAIGLFIFWIVGVGTCAMVGLRVGSDLAHDGSTTNTEVLNSNINEYYISANTTNTPGEGILEDRFSVISLDNDSIYLNNIKLNIYKSKTDSIELKVIKSSNGHSRKDATNNAKMISYTYDVNDSSIFFNNYLSTLKENKIRGQEVRVKLYLPVGKSIYLDNSLEHIVYNVSNVTNTWDKDMFDKKWVMLKDGLTCLDCEDIEGITSFELDSLNNPILDENQELIEQ